MRELRWAGREGRYRALEIRYRIRNGRWTRMPLAGSDGDAGMSIHVDVRRRETWNEFVIFHSDSYTSQSVLRQYALDKRATTQSNQDTTGGVIFFVTWYLVT